MAASEFGARRADVAAGLSARELDALLVTLGPNLRYLSGFTGSNGSLLITAERSFFFTDPRYGIQAAQEIGREGPPVRIKAGKGPITRDIAAAVTRLGVRRIGYEPARITCESYESLKDKLPMRASLIPVNGWIEDLRAVKSPAEIERIRKSVAINSRAFEQAAARVRPGMKERDLAAELEYRMRRLGAEKPAFETIVAAGRRSALPHAQPTAATLENGDLVVVDMGAVEAGYSSDMTRMLFFGKPRA